MSLSLVSNGQSKKTAFSLTAGFVFNHDEFEDFTRGIHLGYNLYYRNTKRLRPDFQVSLNTSGLGNSSSNILSINVLVGGRYYFTKAEKPTKFFVNTLLGGSLAAELGDDFTENLSSVGYTVGLFLDIKRLMIGASIESYNNFILKAGYTF